jgi:hypothetical protein
MEEDGSALTPRTKAFMEYEPRLPGKGFRCTIQGCKLGYNEFHFLKIIKNTDPFMGAQFKSKTHLLNTFYDFWRNFLHVWLQSLKNYKYDLKKQFFEQNKKGITKHRISC